MQHSFVVAVTESLEKNRVVNSPLFESFEGVCDPSPKQLL